MTNVNAASCSVWLLKNGSPPIKSPPAGRGQGRESRIEVPFSSGMQHIQLQSEFVGCCLHLLQFLIGTGSRWVDEQAEGRSRRHQFVQQLEPLWPKLAGQRGHARKIAAWPA
jgi:hypothetical protein